MMISKKFALYLCALVVIGTGFSFAKEVKKPRVSENELASMQKLIEQQSKQIDSLTAEVARLTQLIEQFHSAPAATPASTPAAIPSATPAVPPSVGAQENSVPPASSPPSAVAETPGTHLVAKGETLTSIAKHHKVTVGELLKVNKIEDDRKLQIGQTLVIPTPAPADSSPEKKETH